MNARDIMTRPPHTCGLETPLDEASRLMENESCGTLPVLDDRGRLAGILTDRDIAIAIGRSDRAPAQITARDVMTRNVHTCSPGDDLLEALDEMASAGVRRLPVVDAAGKLRGLLSIDDIILWAVEHDDLKPKDVLRSLRAICAAHNHMFETEAIEFSPVSSNAD